MLTEKQVLNEVVHHLTKANIDESVLNFDRLELIISERISTSRITNKTMLISFSSFDLELEDLDEERFLFFCISGKTLSTQVNDFIFDSIAKFEMSLKNAKKIYLIFIHSEIAIESVINHSKSLIEEKIRKIAKPPKTSRFNRRVVFDYSYVSKPYVPQNRKSIRIASRTGMFSSDFSNSKGHVFTANLYDIVQIYHLIGNELFSQNIRNAISDKYNVDKEIIRTLVSSPEEFWYMNNGITIICDNNTFDYSLMNNIILNSGTHKTLSVINGAQTIRAASRMFTDEKNDKKVTENAEVKAWVLLRIIQLQGETTESDVKSEKITIALNRQKPIQPEDIAFKELQISSLNSFTDNVNEKSDLDLVDFTFKIVRRGDQQSIYKHYYSLEEYARIAYIIYQNDPGTARNASRENLLSIGRENSNADLRKILPHKIEDLSSDEFKKYYLPVNFMLKSKKIIDDFVRKSKQSKPFHNYSRYLLLYCFFNALLTSKYGLTTYSLDGKKWKPDYSSWDLNAKDAESIVKDEMIVSLLDLIEEKWAPVVSKSTSRLDSNEFKNSKNSEKFFIENEESIIRIVIKDDQQSS